MNLSFAKHCSFKWAVFSLCRRRVMSIVSRLLSWLSKASNLRTCSNAVWCCKRPFLCREPLWASIAVEREASRIAGSSSCACDLLRFRALSAASWSRTRFNSLCNWMYWPKLRAYQKQMSLWLRKQIKTRFSTPSTSWLTTALFWMSLALCANCFESKH